MVVCLEDLCRGIDQLGFVPSCIKNPAKVGGIVLKSIEGIAL